MKLLKLCLILVVVLFYPRVELISQVAPSNSAITDSVNKFVKSMTLVISRDILGCIQNQLDIKKGDPIFSWTSENKKAHKFLWDAIKANEDEDAFDKMVSLMRSWMTGDEHFRRRHLCGPAGFAQEILRGLVPMAAMGSLDESGELLASKYLEIARDTAFIILRKQFKNGAILIEEADQKGDPSRYNGILFDAADDRRIEKWWLNKARAYTILGFANMHRKQYDKGREAFENANRLVPFLPEPLSGIGQILTITGDSAKALLYHARANLGYPSKRVHQDFHTMFQAMHAHQLFGAEELLDSLYKTIPQYSKPVALPEPSRASVHAKRRVLLAHTTSLHCSPCAAKDLAVEALEQYYGSENVISLYYHYDPPFRPAMYSFNDMWFNIGAKLNSSPAIGYNDIAVAVDGLPVLRNSVTKLKEQPGYRAGAVWLFDKLRPALEKRLSHSAEASLSISNKTIDGKVEVSVTIDSIRNYQNPLKLHLVLAEKEIRRPGQESIRFQRQVVRHMAGDSGLGFGFLINSKNISHVKYTFHLDSISNLLYKANAMGEGGYLEGYTWKMDVPKETTILKLQNLNVVAFIQDQRTGEVLGVVSEPVLGIDKISHHTITKEITLQAKHDRGKRSGGSTGPPFFGYPTSY